MNRAVWQMLERYACHTTRDHENALKEIIQEIALLGLWRSKFFERAAFYGGSALRILYGLDRFSEDLDFSLLRPDPGFRLQPYLKAVETELHAMGFVVTVQEKTKAVQTTIESAFIKAGTRLHLLKIQVPEGHRIDRNQVLTVKLEVDTNPPGGFETEASTLLQPIPFAVNSYRTSDLFAGKLHAVLQRNWQKRVKGRDFYDLVWYVARSIPCRLAHLESRLRQSGAWLEERSLNLTDLTDALAQRISQLDIEAAREDVLPFVKDPDSVALWSREFFSGLVPRIRAV